MKIVKCSVKNVTVEKGGGEMIKKHLIHWIIFGLLISSNVFLFFEYIDKSWFGYVIQTSSTVLMIYLTIILFIQSRYESEKQIAEQIRELNKSTEKQIRAIDNSTQEKIKSFQNEIRLVVENLKDNSIFLAELLARELEKSIDKQYNLIQQESHQLSKINQFDFFRTREQKNKQILKQKNKISLMKRVYDKMIQKYNQVKKYLKK